MKKILIFTIFLMIIYMPARASYIGHLKEIGNAISNRSITDVLYVNENGSGNGGHTVGSAFISLSDALDAASTDAGDFTLINLAPATDSWDINIAGDPNWTANVFILGSSRNFCKIINSHGSATSIMKLQGKSICQYLNFNLGSGSTDGLIMTHGGSRVESCQFSGQELTGEATACSFIGESTIKHTTIKECNFLGDPNFMTALKFDNVCCSHNFHVHIHECLTGIQILNAASDDNIFEEFGIGACGIALDLDAGNKQHFTCVNLHNNTINIDDEVGDHIYHNIGGSFIMDTLPNDLTGVTVASDASANTWGADTIVLSGASRTKPFSIISYFVIPSASELRKVRFTADDGATYFDEVVFSETKQAGGSTPSGTQFIFNAGTEIKMSTKSISAGPDNVTIWFKIQEI